MSVRKEIRCDAEAVISELLEALERAEALLERYHSFEDLECCATEDVEYRDRLFEREHVRTALAKFGGGQ